MNFAFRHLRQNTQKKLRCNAPWYCFMLVATFAASGPVSARDLEAELVQPFAVHIERTPAQSWPGYGVYLGDGYVITAAHVAGRAEETRPRVVVAGRSLPTRVVKEGSFETNDLTLLRVEPADLPGRLQFRRLSLCAAPPTPDEPVLVAIPESVAPSRILSPKRLPADLRDRFPTAIADVATTGNSGSGVFDARRGCLLGVMSRKIETVTRLPGALHETRAPVGKYFVPAAVIAGFFRGALAR